MHRVLVIDDNKATADVLCSMLGMLDVEAVPAYGARSALLLLDQVKPEAIFLDLNMPGVNGLEILAFLKREPRLQNVPVIVVTSDDQPETQRRARQAGALDLILKPATLEALEAALVRAGVLTSPSDLT